MSKPVHYSARQTNTSITLCGRTYLEDHGVRVVTNDAFAEVTCSHCLRTLNQRLLAKATNQAASDAVDDLTWPEEVKARRAAECATGTIMACDKEGYLLSVSQAGGLDPLVNFWLSTYAQEFARLYVPSEKGAAKNQVRTLLAARDTDPDALRRAVLNLVGLLDPADIETIASRLLEL